MHALRSHWFVSRVDGRQTAPYSPVLEPDIVLIEPQTAAPHAFGVDDTLQHDVAFSGTITLHGVA